MALRNGLEIPELVPAPVRDQNSLPVSAPESASGRGAHAKNELPAARKWVSRLLFICGIGLIAAALIIAGFLVFRYLDAQNRYHQISSVAGLEVPIKEGVVDPGLQLEELIFDWEALRATNPDIVAWVVIPGTRINYPIVQGANNEYYLHHLFDESYSDVGAVFLDFEGAASLAARNNIIYGHNVFDGSMFTDLMQFKTQDFFDQHSTVYLCTPQMNYDLRPFATLSMNENGPLRRFAFATDADFQTYLREMLDFAVARSETSTVADLAQNQVYSFVTCDTLDFSQRVVLSCIPVQSIAPSGVKSQ